MSRQPAASLSSAERSESKRVLLSPMEDVDERAFKLSDSESDGEVFRGSVTASHWIAMGNASRYETRTTTDLIDHIVPISPPPLNS